MYNVHVQEFSVKVRKEVRRKEVRRQAREPGSTREPGSKGAQEATPLLRHGLTGTGFLQPCNLLQGQ